MEGLGILSSSITGPQQAQSSKIDQMEKARKFKVLGYFSIRPIRNP